MPNTIACDDTLVQCKIADHFVTSFHCEQKNKSEKVKLDCCLKVETT